MLVTRSSTVTVPIVRDRHQGDGFRPRLVDVAPLGHAGHDHGSGAVTAGRQLPRVDMAERPVSEARGMQVRSRAGCVEAVALGLAEARVHEPDVDRIVDRRS